MQYSNLHPNIKAKEKGIEIETIVKQAEQHLDKSENLLELMARITAISAHGSSCCGDIPQYHNDEIKELLAISSVSDYEMIERKYCDFHNKQNKKTNKLYDSLIFR